MSMWSESRLESEMCSLISLIPVSGVIYIKAESGNLAESRLPSFVFPDSVLSVILTVSAWLPCCSLICSPLFLPELQRLDEESH